MLTDEFAELSIGDAHGFDAVRIHAVFFGCAQHDFDSAAAGDVSRCAQRIRFLDEPRHSPGQSLVQTKVPPQLRGPSAADACQTEDVDQGGLRGPQVGGGGIAEVDSDRKLLWVGGRLLH